MTTELVGQPYTMQRCRCGHPVCKQWFISVTSSDGRLQYREAILLSHAPGLREALRWALSQLPQSTGSETYQLKHNAAWQLLSIVDGDTPPNNIIDPTRG